MAAVVTTTAELLVVDLWVWVGAWSCLALDAVGCEFPIPNSQFPIWSYFYTSSELRLRGNSVLLNWF